VVVSTHVMPMVEQICDRIGIIYGGKLHGDAPPRELLKARGAATLDEVFFQLAAETEAAAFEGRA
jgi:ABC-type multidrug transport system ATPase subunit